MRASPHSLIASTLIALISAVILRSAILSIKDEVPLNSALLLELYEGKNSFALRRSGGGNSCVGVVQLTISSTPQGKRLESNGWLGLRIGEETLFQSFHGAFDFNPFDQLVGGLVTIPLQREELRVGLLETNPILVKVIRAPFGAATTNVVLEQRVPGPLELNWSGTAFELRAPAVANLNQLTAPVTSPSTSPYGLTLARVAEEGCTRDPSAALDLTPLLSFARGVVPIQERNP